MVGCDSRRTLPLIGLVLGLLLVLTAAAALSVPAAPVRGVPRTTVAAATASPAWASLGTQPPVRDDLGVAYDSAADLFVVYGGAIPGNFTGSTWTYNLNTNTWTNVTPTSKLSARGGFGFVYDSAAGLSILYGGNTSTGKISNKTWTYNLATDTWTKVVPPVSPLGRSLVAMTYDAGADRTILYGGFGATSAYGDTWAYSASANTWTQITTSGPGPLFNATMVYDAAAGRDILFGGEGPGGPSGATWAFNAATGTWTNLNPTTAPSARWGAAMAYDSTDGLVLLFGGSNGQTALSDTWAYSAATNTWTSLSPSTAPSARSLAGAAYDTAKAAMFLFGGGDAAGNPIDDDGWSFTYSSTTTSSPPGAPQNLSATAGSALVTLTWQAPASSGSAAITNYVIERGTASGTETAYATVGNVLTYTDTGVTNGVTYYYKVAATSSAGTGPLSNEASATPVDPLTAATAPQNLTATGGVLQVVLNWQAPASNGGSPITGYNVYRGLTSGSETPYTSVGAVLTYTDSGVAAGVTYYYQVTALNALGESQKSNEASATPTVTTTAPSPPQSLTATGGSSQVVLAWQAPSSTGGSAITGYKVYRGTASGGETAYANLSVVLTYTDTAVTNGVTYFYKVTALNAKGESNASNEASATPTSPATVPGAPRNLTANASQGHIVLAWQAPLSNGGSAITGYNVYRGTVAGNESLYASVGNVLTYADATAAVGVTYYYKVTAVNAVGESAKSNEASATAVGTGTVPSAPLAPAAKAGNATVTLTWSPPASPGGSAVTNYAVYRGTSSGSEVLLTILGDVLTYADTGVTNGVTYYYELSAINSAGGGPRSSEVNATPVAPPSVPGAPRNLVATPGNAQVTLAWAMPISDGGSPVTAFKVYRGTASGAETLLMTLDSILGVTDTAVANGVTYYYQVSAVNGAGEGPRSSEVSATPNVPPTPPAPPSDPLPPSLNVTSPADGSTVSTAVVRVAGNASDDVSVTQVELSTDGVTWTPATGTTNWTGNVTLRPGANTIYVRATDVGGSIHVASVRVTYQGPLNLFAFLSLNDFEAILLTALVATSIGLAVFVPRRARRSPSRKKAKRPETKEESPPWESGK